MTTSPASTTRVVSPELVVAEILDDLDLGRDGVTDVDRVVEPQIPER